MNSALYLFTQAGFAAVTFVFYGLTLRELKQGLESSAFAPDRKKKLYWRTLLGLFAWMMVISILSISGFFEDFSSTPPKMAIVFIVPLITILIVTFSNTMKEILIHIPAQNIVRLQVFRVLVEILLWLLFIQRLLPVQMTFEGRNWDVLAGISAPIFAYLFLKLNWPKTAVILWNIAGLLLLLNIILIALLSMPTPFRVFMNEPSSSIVARFPMVWLPGFLVPLAYGLHFFSLRQALNKKVQG